VRTFDEIASRLTNPTPCGNSIRSRCQLCDGKNLSLTRFPDGGACLKCFNCPAIMAELFAALASKPEHPSPRRVAIKQVTDQERISRALNIWREAKPMLTTLAEYYLRDTRKILEIPLPPTLRFNPSVWHAETKRNYPAMVAAIQRPDRSIVGVHVSYLQGGPIANIRVEKAAIEPNKKMFGVVRGCSVHLGPIRYDTLAIAEGIESALSYTIISGGATCWAALSASGIATLTRHKKALGAYI
jgi:hypothetical protein